MPDSTRPLHAEVWAWWIVVGLADAAFYLHPFVPAWLGLIGLPWAAGAMLLWAGESRRLAARLAHVLSDAKLRVAVATLFLLVLLVFGPGGVLAAGTWGGLLLLGLAWLTTAETVRSVVLRLGLLSIGLFAACGLAEALLRIPPVARSWGSPAVREAWQERYDDVAERNIFGLRTPYERVEKPDSALRIAALGDSFTWGIMIPETDSTWPARVERILRDRKPSTHLQVLNLGEGGYTAANEIERMTRLGWQFDPDIVLIQFLVNDAYPSAPNFVTYRDSLFPPVSLVPVRFREHGLADESALLSFLNQTVHALRIGPDSTRYDMLYSPDWPGWRQLQEAYRELADSAEVRGVPVGLVIHPMLTRGRWTAESHPHADIHAKMVRLGRNLGFEVLDLTPTFAEEGEPGEYWWAEPWDSHPNSAALAIVARRVADFVEEELWSQGLVSAANPGSR